MNAHPRARTQDWAIRGVFALFAAAGLWFLLRGAHWRGPSSDGVAGDLAWTGFVVAASGMAATWRWLPRLGVQLEAPGDALALCSKLLGWVGIGVLPWAVWREAWVVAAAGVGVAASAAGLWRARTWAVWAWYVICAAVLATALLLLGMMLQTSPEDLHSRVGFARHRAATIIHAAALLLIGGKLLPELRQMHRRLRQRPAGVPRTQAAG